MRAGAPVSIDTRCDDRIVAKLTEAVEIAARPDRVWSVVADDVINARKWTSYLEKVEKLDDGPPGKGTRYRYHLDLPALVEEGFDHDHGRGWPRVAHHLVVRPADGVAMGGVSHEHARTHHVFHRGAGFAKGGRDDLETPHCLDIRIGIHRAVGPDGCRA